MRLNNTFSTHVASKFVLQRELGLKFGLGFQDKLNHKIYSSLKPFGYWDPSLSVNSKSGNTIHGGVFNLEYSPDGSTLIAACEQKSFIVLDPTTRRDVHHVHNAHSDCVNCVRFLDSRTFATCSDDTTIVLWDVRNLKQRMRSLRGHSNWVKNIEFVRSEGLLVTSGFDGCVYTWDINSYPEHGLISQRVFHSNGLMRMRLTPDASKMVLCTAGGYIMVIHNLDFATLNEDLAGFKPNMYRLMQLSQTPITMVAKYSHLFTAKRNRVELISDWPENDEAEVVSALQVHPFGWCVLSRNTSNSDKSEWTCVHDIQDIPGDSPVVPRKRSRLDDESSQPSTSYPMSSSSSSSSSADQSDEDNPVPAMTTASAGTGSQVQVRFTAPLQWGARPGEGAGFHLRLEGASDDEPSENLEVNIPSEDVLEALESIRQARAESHPEFRIRRRAHRQNSRTTARTQPSLTEDGAEERPSQSTSSGGRAEPESSGESTGWEDADHAGLTTAHFVRAVADLAARSIHLLDPFRLRSRHGGRRHPPSLTYNANSRSSLDMHIHSNVNRITHFVQEPNVGRGYIKELCFSPDGRVIASPFGNGVRLLTFNPQCTDMTYCLPQSFITGARYSDQGAEELPSTLHELSNNQGFHNDVVVTTKFSPTHPVFVSGCLGGKIVWYQPLL